MKPKVPCDIWPVNDGMDGESFPGDLEYDEIIEAIEDLFSEAGIKTPSYENPVAACLTPKGKVWGAATGGLTGAADDDYGADAPVYTYRFSVVVSPKARRKGIARRLVKEIEDDARMTGEAHEGYIILEAWVVNPLMADLLDSMGYEGEGEWTPDSPFMRKNL